MTQPRTSTPHLPSIDINADVGEECGDDLALLEIVTSANIACGAHAGGPTVMRETVATARVRGVRIGAHVSYSDRANFGRRAIAIKPAAISNDI